MLSVYETINTNPLTSAHAYMARQIDAALGTGVVSVLGGSQYDYTLTVPTNDAWTAFAQSVGYNGADVLEAIDFVMSVASEIDPTTNHPEFFALFWGHSMGVSVTLLEDVPANYTPQIGENTNAFDGTQIIDNDGEIANANIIDQDIVANNGLINIIDQVLLNEEVDWNDDDGLNVITGTPDQDDLTGTESVDLIDGLDNNDDISGKGGNDFIFGGDGNDEIFGGDGGDYIEGGRHIDRLFGGEGDDEIFGGHAADYIRGGDGDDEIFGGSSGDQIYGDAGNDLIFGDSGGDVLEGGAGNDDINGGAGRDALDGGEGNDILSGANGKDDLRGRDGDDELYGGSQADRLFGGDGNDLIDGGKGNDRMTGGDGADIFVFAGTTNTDRITDFEIGVDKIDIAALGPLTGAEIMAMISGNGNAVIDFGETGVVHLSGAAAADLQLSDFIYLPDETFTVG